MKKPFTIIADDTDGCYLCGSYRMIEWPHIFGASNRKKSTQYGLVVPLCRSCHNEPPNGVHHNANTNRRLKTTAQQKAMEHYGWDVDTFRSKFGKNYL